MGWAVLSNRRITHGHGPHDAFRALCDCGWGSDIYKTKAAAHVAGNQHMIDDCPDIEDDARAFLSKPWVRPDLSRSRT